MCFCNGIKDLVVVKPSLFPIEIRITRVKVFMGINTPSKGRDTLYKIISVSFLKGNFS